MIKIAGFIIDAAPVETHDLGSVVTEHPVEEGADITDHIRVTPDRLSIEGVVSNTPIGAIADIRNNESPFAGEFLPANDCLAFLRQIRANREPVTVETTIHVYDNMVLVNLSIPQEHYDALKFRADFQEVQIVKTERTAVPVSTPTAQKKGNLGTQQSPQVDASKALEREKQFRNATRKKWHLTHNPSLGTDLL